jgi:replicative DNA helicase
MGVIENNKAIKNQIGEEITVSNINEILTLSTYIARDTAEEYKKLVSIVSDLFCKRKLVRDLETCKKECFRDDLTISDLHKKVQTKIDEVAIDFVTSDVVSFGDIIMNIWKDISDKFANGEANGYSCKFQASSEYYNFELGELVLLAARRKDGKSIFALNQAVHLLQNELGVLYVDTELKDELFTKRLLAHLCLIKFSDIKYGRFTPTQAEDIKEKLKWITKQNFHHLYMPIWDKEKLYLIAKKLKKENNKTVFIFDHLKTTTSADSSVAYHELGSKVNFLKDTICGELNYAGFCLAQLNRSGDIGDSYKLEQEVSTVLNIKRKTEDEIMRDTPACGNYKLFVKANRNGDAMDDIETDYIDLHFWGELCTFDEAKQHKKRDETPFE